MWLKATLASLRQHGKEVIVLCQRVLLLVKDAVVTRYMAVAVSPQQRDEVDAADHRMVFARPVALNQLHLLGKGFVQSRVVYDKDALGQTHLAVRFPPQRCGIRFKAVQEARESVMCRGLRFVRLHSCRFGRTHRARGVAITKLM